MEEKVEYLFDKKFTFSKPDSGWPLVPPEEIFLSENWRIPQMMNFKKELNDRKATLNDLDLVQWHRHTRMTNVGGTVVWRTRKKINPEFITQAWCKFYEIVSNYPVIPQKVEKLNSVHLCESPGAFIAALNHYLKLNHRETQWDWMASSLNPHYEENARVVTVPDDRFLLCSLDKWKFGADQTGNIMNLANLESLVEESRKMGPVLLVTADGGFDCQDQPGEQEEMVFSLLFCQAVAALHILSAGGSFVLKSFTMFEHTTICLIYFLNTCFETVNVFKPVTSKEGNSECYVVCLNYVGADERKAWLRKFQEVYGEKLPNNAIFPLEKIPQDFIDQLLECAEKFKLYQEDVLERNVFLFTIPQPGAMKELENLRNRIAEIFREKCNLRRLNGEKDEVVGKAKLAQVLPLQMDSRYENGSFNERLKWHQLPPKEKFPLLMEEIRRYNAPWNGNIVNWFNLTRESIPIQILRGKPVNAVRSSKFCSCQLLELRYKFHTMLRLFSESPENVEFAHSQKLSAELKNILMDFCPEILTGEVKIVDFGDTLLSSCLERNEEFERKALLLITDVIASGEPGLNLILDGFPMLTRFSVGFIFLWAQLFEQVGFVKPKAGSSAVIFRNFHSSNRDKYNFRDLLKNDKDSIVSIVPINELVDDHQFYAQVVAANTYTLKNELSRKFGDLTSNF